MTKQLLKVGVLLLTAGALGGCESMSETANAWYGQAKNTLSSDAERGFIDRQTGDAIGADDAALLSAKLAETLETAAPEESVAWRSPKSGASGWIKAGKRVKERRTITSVRDLGLANAPLAEIIGSPYRSVGNVNIRSGPSTKHVIVGRLKKDEILTALARVEGVKWLMVGREGQAIGYVYAPLLRPAKGAAAAAAATSMGLRDPGSADSGGSESDKPGAGAEAETLTARTPCRNVLYNLAPEGGDAQKYRFRACKAGDGAWQVTPRTVAESND